MTGRKQPTKSSTALLTFSDFFEQFPLKKFKKRSPILNAGFVPPDIYYLKRGYARTYGVSSEGEELTMVIFQPGDFFPLISTIQPKRIDYYIESLTEVDVIPVPRLKFLELLQTEVKQGRERLLIDFVMRLTARFEGVLNRMEHLVFGTASQRLASIILILGERFGEKRGSVIFVKSPLTHKDIASLVGITRETTTLILRDFVKKGYISFTNKHIYIENLSGLQKVAMVT